MGLYITEGTGWLLEEDSLPSFLTINFLNKKQTDVHAKTGRIWGSMCIEEMKKIRTDPEDEEEIADEIHLPTLLILKLLNSWDTK